jgi:hypothetical protein
VYLIRVVFAAVLVVGMALLGGCAVTSDSDGILDNLRKQEIACYERFSSEREQAKCLDSLRNMSDAKSYFAYQECLEGAQGSKETRQCKITYVQRLYDTCIEEAEDLYYDPEECDEGPLASELRILKASVDLEETPVAQSLSPMGGGAPTTHTLTPPPGFVACPNKPNVFIPQNVPINICNTI